MSSFARFLGLSGSYPSAIVVSYASLCSGIMNCKAESAGPDLFTVKIYFSLPVNCLKKVRVSESSQSEMITGKIFALYF